MEPLTKFSGARLAMGRQLVLSLLVLLSSALASAEEEREQFNGIPIFTPGEEVGFSQESADPKAVSTHARVEMAKEDEAALMAVPGSRERQYHVRGMVFELAPGVMERAQAILAEIPRAKRYEALVRFLHNELEPEEARLLAQPTMVVSEDSWASIRFVRKLTYPSEYDPAQFPEAFSDLISIDGAQKKRPETHGNDSDSPSFLPPFPKSFVDREVGLVTRIRPHSQRKGAVSLELEVEQSSLAGFVDYGTPIRLPHPGALHRNADPLVILENQILLPAFSVDREQVSLNAREGGFYFQDPGPAPATDTLEDIADLGTHFARPWLSPLVWLFWADPLEGGGSAPKSDGEKLQEAETRSWVLSPSARKSLGMKDRGTGEETAEYLRARLEELGVSLEAITVDPEWKIEIAATAPSLDRVDELLSIYGQDQQIFLTFKVIESDRAIDWDDGPVLDEGQANAFFRRIQQQRGLELLSAPSVLSRPFQSATVEVVREFIYPTEYTPPSIPGAKKEPVATSDTRAEDNTFPVSPSQPLEFDTRNVGVTLKARPRLLEGDQIEIAFAPEVAEFEGFLNFGQPIYQLEKGPLGKYRRVMVSENRMEMPVFGRRAIETVVRIPDGGTAILGGIVKTDVQDVEDKVPLLGDLPIIGQAARSRSTLEVKRFLYFTVRAQLVDPAGGPVKREESQDSSR